MHPLSAACPSVKGRQRSIRRTLVYEHKALRVDRGHYHHPKGCPQKLVALTRTQRPFFRPKPIERIARERVDSLTDTPAALRRYSCLCLSVVNGRSSTSASSSFLAFSSRVGLLPGAFPGESERLSRTALR